MIWGEVINCVRKLHLSLVQEFSVDPALYTRDLEVDSDGIPFPEAIDDFDEWQETPMPQELQDILPLHPVERALIEGPLLPIQLIRFGSAKEIDALFGRILRLENSWLEISKTRTPERTRFVEVFLQAQALKLITRAGFRKLTSLKEEP